MIEQPNGQNIDKDAYIKTIKNLFKKMPDKPVKRGSTFAYSQESEIPMSGGGLVVTTDYNYKFLEEIKKDGFDCIKIEVKITQKTEGEFEQRGNKITMSEIGQGSSSLYFAYKKGMLISGEETITSEGTAELDAMGLSIPISRTVKSSFNVTFNK